MIRNKIYVHDGSMIALSILLLGPGVITLKLLRCSRSFLRSLNLSSITWLNVRLLMISMLFLIVGLVSIIKIEFSYIILFLIVVHWITFYTSDFLIVLLLSDLMISRIVLRFRLSHNSNYDYSSNMYLVYYVLLPSAPLLAFILNDMRKGLSIREICNYFVNLNLASLNRFICVVVLLSRMAKLPIYGLHYWLPKAHVQAPTILSIILARLSLKIRLLVFSFVYTMINCPNYLILRISLVLLFRIMCSTYRRVGSSDYKVFLAYCSVAHITIACLRIISVVIMGYKGAWLIRLAHCFTSPFLFYIVRNSQYNTRTRNFSPVTLNKQTVLILVLLGLLLIDLPFPPVFSFWREVSILNSIFRYMRYISVFIFLPLILILRGYESVYRSLKNYVCSKITGLFLRAFSILVISGLL